MRPGTLIEKRAPGRTHLLVAENDPLVRRWLAAGVDPSAVELQFVDCAVALSAARERQPHCVVVDAVSCLQDETPLWQQLAEIGDGPPLPVLVYASSDRWRAAAELARGPMTDHLQRPFSPQMLVDAAMRLAHRQRGSGRRCLRAGVWGSTADAAA
jgi:DNA-binding NtrC family response regulator